MPLQKLQFRPGVVRDVPAYTNTGGWYDCNHVRFKNGFPQVIGGWQKYSTQAQFLGTCRDLISWVTVEGASYIGVGTTWKYYLQKGGTLNDITPIRKTSALTDPFTVTNGSSVMTVTDVAHGCVVNDFVTFSGATGLGGNVTASVLNREYQIVSVPTTSTYTVTLPVTANASDTGNGGSVTAEYQINVGLDTQVGGTGWGAGTWGRGGWGSGTTTSVGNTLRLWSSDNFGEDLLFNVRNGGVYFWSPSYGGGSRGVALSSLSTDPACPTIASVIRTSDNDRHVIAFGGNNFYDTDGSIVATQDPLLVKWSDQEDYTVWTSTATNSAGDFRLGAGTRIVHAVETKREIAIWTDLAVYSMQYTGPPYTFGITQIAANTTILGYNTFANVEDEIYWMGNGKFYIYNGRTSEVPCPVINYVFNNLNYDQSDKIYAAINSKYNEVTWFYPSASSFENDSYVTYNYAEKAWTYGTMVRTAWLDRGTDDYPIAAGTDGYLYNHDYGVDDGSTNPPSPINAYIQSAPIEIENGDKYSFIRRIIPDVGFFNSIDNPRVVLTLKMQAFPGSMYGNTSASTISQTATVPIEQFTEQAFVRLRGRQMSFRIESNKVGTTWGLGTPRVEIQPDGKR